MMEEATLRIGEVAEQAGLSVSAIRFYERSGLLEEPERLQGQRRYSAQVLWRLHLIEVGKRAGLCLAEVRELLLCGERGTPAHVSMRAIAARKLPEVEAQIERAQVAREWLAAAAQCGCESLDSCALFVA